MNKKLTDHQLQQKIAELPSAIQPERDLWQGIEHAISQQQSIQHEQVANHHWRQPFVWAASIVFAVIFTWQLSHVDSTTYANISPADEMMAVFNQQKSALLVALQQQNKAPLPTVMQQQIDELTAAQLTINKALKNDPDNTDLINLLRYTQQQELKLLTQLYQPKWQSI